MAPGGRALALARHDSAARRASPQEAVNGYGGADGDRRAALLRAGRFAGAPGRATHRDRDVRAVDTADRRVTHHVRPSAVVRRARALQQSAIATKRSSTTIDSSRRNADPKLQPAVEQGARRPSCGRASRSALTQVGRSSPNGPSRRTATSFRCAPFWIRFRAGSKMVSTHLPIQAMRIFERRSKARWSRGVGAGARRLPG